MLQVKKYRAATTREALEQVKQELGEQAFVLETKRVQTKGFLGFGAQSQIEISAALPAEAKENAAAPKVSKTRKESILKLSLTDDAPAIPAKTNAIPDAADNEILRAINVRETSAQSVEKNVSVLREKIRENVFSPAKNIETVEITEAAPRFVHPKKEPVKKSAEVAAEPAAAKKREAEPAISNKDFEMLRAELREVKFTLGAFANRHHAQTWQNSSNDFELVDELFDSPFYEAYTDLTSTGLSNDLARKIITDIIPQYRDGKIPAEHLAKTALFKAFSSLIKFERSPLQTGEPAILAVIGATGVGKTTTLAKLASRVALRERRRVELVTLDTYRIAAVEQLKTYAEIIGAGCHVVRSVFELDAVLCRLPQDASILIDTTGKSPHDLADQHEVADYLRHRPEIRKCLVTQATAHPIDSYAAVKKFEMYGADCLALTKMDETMRPGAMFELAAQSNLPLIYLCMGQRVPEDLQDATPHNFIAHIFREQGSPKYL